MTPSPSASPSASSSPSPAAGPPEGHPGLRVTVRYFAALREALGPQDTVELPVGASVATLRAQLRSRGDRHAHWLAGERAVRAAVNQVMAQDDTPLPDGAEVAFFPPVTGG